MLKVNQKITQGGTIEYIKGTESLALGSSGLMSGISLR